MIDPSIPLVELHRHLDGSVRLETILDLGLQHNLKLPATDIESLRPYVQVTDQQPDILAFFEKFKWQTGVLVDYEACRRVAYENVDDAARDGIAYIELRFSPYFMAQAHGLDPSGVVEAVVDGVQAGSRDFKVKTGLIGILSRTYGPQTCQIELDALMSRKEDILALDLAGDEANYPAEWYLSHFKEARDAGWRITVHAGEAAGPESIWKAIELLGAERLGHAVTAVQDQRLMDALRERRIGVESNLTSNVQTSTVPDYASHPLRRFLEHGVLATINTDDPGISAIDLPYEYTIAAPAAGLSERQIAQAQRNAVEVAFLSEAERQQLWDDV